MRTERGLQGETQRTAGGGVGVAVMRAHTHMHGLCVMNPTATVYEISLYTAPRSGCMFLRCLRMHARMRACVGVLTAWDGVLVGEKMIENSCTLVRYVYEKNK